MSDGLHFGYDDLTVEYNGKGITLNKNLLDSQSCWKNLDKLKECHYKKLIMLEKMENTEDPIRLKAYARKITSLEFELQELWGFPQDTKWHKFWELPKCSCSKMDNNDAYPTGFYSTNMSCLVHGTIDKKAKRVIKNKVGESIK